MTETVEYQQDGKPAEENTLKIIAIGGGKGGIGKTVMTASMGVGLANLKRQVVVVDADFGGANLHTVMGIDKPTKTFYNFYTRECQSLDEILLDHPHFENIQIICGASGSMGIVNLPYYQKLKFIRHLKKLKTDFIIIDLGAGTSYNVLDLFLAADMGIVLVNPDPLSILEGYNFMKQAFYRKLIKALKQYNGPLEVIKEYARWEIHKEPLTVESLLEKVTEMDHDAGQKMKSILEDFHPRLLINMLKDSKDETNGLAVKIATKDLLSLDVEYLGSVHTDNIVHESLEKMIPFISYDPKSTASRDLANIIISKILHAGRFRAIRDRKIIRKSREKWSFHKHEAICTVKCIYWEECEYRNGGYPCKLQHLVQLSGFHGEEIQ